MITNLYNRYFQKSRSFLYPALGLSKDKQKGFHSPVQTYIAYKDIIKIEDKQLLCQFNTDEKNFNQFEKKYIHTHPLYKYTLDKGVYIFNYNTYGQDWDYFIQGKYSKLSDQLKNSIKIYYGEKSQEYKYIHTYLYPDKHFSMYSKLLDIDRQILESNGELCDTFNKEKETLILSEKLVIIE